jgi:hypothetical protein
VLPELMQTGHKKKKKKKKKKGNWWNGNWQGKTKLPEYLQ